MIMQTQDQWLDSKYEAANVEGGLAFPDFERLSLAYGFRTITIKRNAFMLSGVTFTDSR